MATFTINTAPWPSGTIVPVYTGRAWVDTARAPSGPQVTTGTVAPGGSVTFTGLAEQGRYAAYALGTGVRFGTGPTGPQQPVAIPDRERLKTLEDNAGNARVLLWNAGQGTYTPTAYLSQTGSPREFIGPTDPATIAGVTLADGERWTRTPAP
jgi:hypothetical protein